MQLNEHTDKGCDIDKYRYSGYGIGFNSERSFSHPSGGFVFYLLFIFGADMGSSAHANNKQEAF